MNYCERFPLCNGCPTLAQLQDVRDRTANEFEEISLDAIMENAEIDYYVEEVRKEYDGLIQELLDNGALETDASVVNLREEYDRLKAHITEATNLIRATEEYVEQEFADILNETDKRAEWVVAHCVKGIDTTQTPFECESTANPEDMPPLDEAATEG